MKKSTTTLIIAALGTLLIFTSLNLKLQSEYNKKNIFSTLIYTKTEGFHHVKEITKKKNDFIIAHLAIEIRDTIGFVGIAKEFEATDTIAYRIKNDTLYVLTDSLTQNKYLTAKLYCSKLKSINTSTLDITAPLSSTDSLSIIGSGITKINFGANKLNYLLIEGRYNASINVWGADTIRSAIIKLHDLSNFTATNSYYLNKELIIDKNATISFSGKSLKSFGIVTNQP